MAGIPCRPIPASLSARRIPPLPAPQALSAPNCCACNSAAGRGIEAPATAASAPALVGVVRGSEPVVSPIAIQRREPCPQARSRLEARIHHSRCEEPQVAGPTLSLEKLGPRFSPVLVETIKAPRRTAIEGEFFVRRASSGDALERVPQRRVAGSHVVDGKIALEIAPFGAE